MATPSAGAALLTGLSPALTQSGFAAPAYPFGLRTILRASKARQQAAPFLMSDPKQGYAWSDVCGYDRPVVWNVQFAFTQAEAATFRAWFNDAIDEGKLEFVLAIRTEFGLLEHLVRFLPGSLLDLKEIGAVFTYSAQIAARQRIWPAAPAAGFTETSWTVDIGAVTNGGSTSATGILLTGFDATRTYRVTRPTGRLYTGYSAWPTDGSSLPPATPSNQKWGNAFEATQFPGANVGSGDARTTTCGVDRGYVDGEAARAAFVPAVIGGATQFKFWINDPNPSDNRGGASLLIQPAVPDYPLDMRTVVRPMKSRSQPAAFGMDQPRRGLGYVRAVGTATPFLWEVGFRFTQSEASTFSLWFKYAINEGVDPFYMPLRTEYGFVTYPLQFLPGTLLDLQEEGEVFTYRASVLAREEIVA